MEMGKRLSPRIAARTYLILFPSPTGISAAKKKKGYDDQNVVDLGARSKSKWTEETLIHLTLGLWMFQIHTRVNPNNDLAQLLGTSD